MVIIYKILKIFLIMYGESYFNVISNSTDYNTSDYNTGVNPYYDYDNRGPLSKTHVNTEFVNNLASSTPQPSKKKSSSSSSGSSSSKSTMVSHPQYQQNHSQPPVQIIQHLGNPHPYPLHYGEHQYEHFNEPNQQHKMMRSNSTGYNHGRSKNKPYNISHFSGDIDYSILLFVFILVIVSGIFYFNLYLFSQLKSMQSNQCKCGMQTKSLESAVNTGIGNT